MELANIQEKLASFAEELTSQTYLGTYRVQGRDSLLKDGLGTRANSIWKMAQYIIAVYEKQKNPIVDYLSGWKTLVKHYKNQYLIIQTDEEGHNWEMYDSNCNKLGGNDYIKSLFREVNLDSKQIIYYGCPGSGKSRQVKDKLQGVVAKFKLRTTFHPDTDYASFVGCYKPFMNGGNIEYSYSAQVFTKAYVQAWKHPEEKVYLIIEEINRGNCAQIFGDLFQLLDRDRDTGESEYPVKADKDLADYLVDVLGADHEGIKGGELKLPSNLIIYATMNTSDQSLFPMDSAFKRRWDWEYVPIEYGADKESYNYIITIGSKKYRWVDFLKIVNKKIYDTTRSEDKQMGNFFIKKSVDAQEFINKVMFYLWNEVCKEEVGTSRNFFRIAVEGNNEGEEFKFVDLFDKANTNDLLIGFMNHLKVGEYTE